jgi:spermidine/putrescine transport system substrate-binding protein
MPADMKDAPELTIPKEMEGHYEFNSACPQEATEIYTKIWTELMK